MSVVGDDSNLLGPLRCGPMRAAAELADDPPPVIAAAPQTDGG